MGAFVQTRAVIFESARSFLRAAWSSQRTRSGHTSLTNASRLLSGNHFGTDGAGRHVGDAARFAAVDRDDVDLALGVVAALGDERDPLAVGTHRGLRVAGLVAGELARGAAGDAESATGR